MYVESERNFWSSLKVKCYYIYVMRTVKILRNFPQSKNVLLIFAFYHHVFAVNTYLVLSLLTIWCCRPDSKSREINMYLDYLLSVCIQIYWLCHESYLQKKNVQIFNVKKRASNLRKGRHLYPNQSLYYTTGNHMKWNKGTNIWHY